MGFAAIGVIMLAVVFIFYMRMVDARLAARKGKDPIRQLIEKAAVFEAVADDQAALQLINEALQEYPGQTQLLAKQQQLQMRINGEEKL